MKIKNFRKKVLAPSLSLSYDSPLHLIRGRGQFLYDVNGEKYLDRCNKSIISQEYKNFENIALDNASTDNLKIILKYKKK